MSAAGCPSEGGLVEFLCFAMEWKHHRNSISGLLLLWRGVEHGHSNNYSCHGVEHSTWIETQHSLALRSRATPTLFHVPMARSHLNDSGSSKDPSFPNLRSWSQKFLSESSQAKTSERKSSNESFPTEGSKRTCPSTVSKFTSPIEV